MTVEEYINYDVCKLLLLSIVFYIAVFYYN